MAEEKTATNVDEQIIKLKSRGMIIADETKAKENLLDIGYYRLGFYWFPFEKSYPRKDHRTHEFKEGTKFDYAIKLYYFDFDLRNILLRYISRIEINFRTQLIYIVSNKYKEDPFWYLNPKILKPNFINCNLFQNAINEAKKESTIRMDLDCHNRNNSPAWKLIENFTFGVVISIYDNLIDGGLKHDISVAYGMQSPSQFSNYINTVRRLRNYCAHEKVLFDMTLPAAISNGPIGYLATRKTMLFGAYKVFKYLLGRVSDNRVSNMKAKLLNAFARVQYQEVKDIIFDNSGFRIEEI
jgi:abortive infection bacteriophage resistance protein